QRQHSELLAKFQAQEVEINRLKERVKLLEAREGVAAERFGDDAPIKGRSLDEGEAAAERTSDNTEEMATVLTSMDAAIVLASRAAEVSTSSGSIPIAGPPADEVPTGSDVVPTACPVFATATVIARVLTSMDATTVLAGRIDVPTGSGVIPTTGPHATVISIGSEVEDFIPMGSKEETKRLKRKGLNLEKEQVKKQKSSEEALEIESSTGEFTEEKMKEMYKFSLPVKIVTTVERKEMPLPEVCTAIEEKKKKLPESEKEAIHFLLTGIGDEIYLIVDACKTAHEIWIAIERLQQGESLSIKITVTAAQQYPAPYYQAPKSHKSYAPPSKHSSSTRSNASTKFKGKEKAKPIIPLYESVSEEDSDPKQAQRDKDMQKNLALIAKEKMLLCKLAEIDVPLQAMQADWLEDTDEEIDEQDLEAHYTWIFIVFTCSGTIVVCISWINFPPIHAACLEKLSS
nr:hypothetical protein [Tanacetum cinerariifolium]